MPLNLIRRRFAQLLVASTAAAALGNIAGKSSAQTNSAQGNTQPPAPTGEREIASNTKLNGKVAFITGAARGIGRATALTLAREGADIFALDIADPDALKGTIGYPLATPKDLQETQRLVRETGQRCLTMQADVRNAAQVRQAVERAINELGKVDILVANAGILPRVPLVKVTDELWANTIGVNLTGVGNAIRAVAPHMIARKSGQIVAVASNHGRKGAVPFHVYTASKWGVIGLVKSVALELAEHRITVNAVSPGFTRTGMTQNPEVYGRLRPDVPNPRAEDIVPVITADQKEQNLLPVGLLEPEDIANGVLYLVSDAARYVTGVALDITAGENAHYTA
jgi:SDR family mycofactocin-dependent oxidoreductase